MNTASLVPFYLMPRIMKAYTGKRKAASVPMTKQILPQKQLLKDYESRDQVEGIYYRRSRIIIYCCLVIFFVILVFYLLRYAVNRVKGTRKYMKAHRLAVAAKFLIVVNALVCLPFALLLLDDGRALEELSIYDLSRNLLNLPSLVYFVTQIPVYSSVITSIVILLGIVSWVRRFWDLPERLVYTLVTVNAVVFIWVTYDTIMIG